MFNEHFLTKADSVKPLLKEETIKIKGPKKAFSTNDEYIFDLKDHYVGYVDIDFTSVGHHMDAPCFVQINFAEILEEFEMNAEDYHGWICKSWIQEERVHIDKLPHTLSLNRRYAFRYIKIKILAVSDNYKVCIKNVSLRHVSSANYQNVEKVRMNKTDSKIDKVALRTLHNCMQDVFEDGPKRDRRLWLGDLRLQALANYETFKNNDLVKRCLYLFASSTLQNGRLASNIFTEPEVECDFQAMFDYTLFFINTLWEYYEHTNDIETLKDLEPVCIKQHKLLKKCFTKDHLLNVNSVTAGRVFVDWNFDLDKQVSGQGIYISALNDLVKIEKELGYDTKEIEKDINLKKEAALKHFYNSKKGLFVSNNQISYASQIWMVLSKTVDKEKAQNILKKIKKVKAVEINSPYMKHYYIQALIDSDMYKQAHQELVDYWGKMVEMNADTFWELFNPEDKNYSPYGGLLVHSFCHAWSCTPTYFLRKYFYNESK